MNNFRNFLYSIITAGLCVQALAIEKIKLPAGITREDFIQECPLNQHSFFCKLFDKNVPKLFSPEDSFVLRHLIKQNNHYGTLYIWTITDKAEIEIASIQTSYYGENKLIIPFLNIDDNYQGHGIGSALIRLVGLYASRFAHKRVYQLRLNCLLGDRDEERRERFYRKNGFTPLEDSRDDYSVIMTYNFKKHSIY